MRAPDQLIAAQRALKERFRYTSQPNETGPMRTWVAEVLAGKKWYGDCDDYAATACDYLANHLNWPHAIFYQMCRTEQNQLHVVCLALDEHGVGWVMDNRYSDVSRSVDMFHYRWGIQTEWWHYMTTGSYVFKAK